MFYLITLLLLAVPAAEAQMPRVLFPWWESPMVRDLNLSEEQGRQIRTVLRESRSQLIDLRAAVEKAEGELEDYFNEDTVDQKKTAESIEKLVQARSELTRAYSMVGLKLRAVLTTQQWRELQRRRPHPQGQPGPPGRGPAPGQRPGPGPRPGPPPE